MGATSLVRHRVAQPTDPSRHWGDDLFSRFEAKAPHVEPPRRLSPKQSLHRRAPKDTLGNPEALKKKTRENDDWRRHIQQDELLLVDKWVTKAVTPHTLPDELLIYTFELACPTKVPLHTSQTRVRVD